MNENKFTSNAEWPPEAGIENNISSDNHSSREAANGVCDLLKTKGFGGDGKIFPLRTWVEPIERPYDILNNGRPLSIVWADSPEKAIEIVRAAHQETSKYHHEPYITKLGRLTAVPRLQEE